MGIGWGLGAGVGQVVGRAGGAPRRLAEHLNIACLEPPAPQSSPRCGHVHSFLHWQSCLATRK